MALEVYWTKKAVIKYDNIIAYLLVEFGETTTSNFIKKIFVFLDLLAIFLEMGTLENRELNIRGFVIKQITIFYQVRNKQIILLNFYDNRQRPKKIRF